MEFLNTEIEGVKLVKVNNFSDYRGELIKVFNDNEFIENNIEIDIKECYYSISKKDVVRGMHFQKKPYDHNKLVSVINGQIIDVVLDLRKDSSTYKKYISVELSRDNNLMIYIPKGCAHGFKSLEDNSIVMYNVSTVYAPKYDSGIRYDSFGMKWDIKNPIISERDKSFITLKEFEDSNID